MSIFRFFGMIGSGVVGFIFKIMFIMILIMVILGAIMIIVIYWPFTIAFIIGLLLCEFFYKYVDERFKLNLPDYFFINITDFIATFSEGDAEAQVFDQDIKDKKAEARKQLAEITDANNSIDEQLAQIKVKRSLKTLFIKPIVDVSPRAAKALEMELGKPSWVKYIDKTGTGQNRDFDKFYA